MKKLFGLSIVLLLSASLRAHGTPKWAEDIAKIIYTKCAPCHYSGGIGPFALTSYQDAKDHGSSIKSSIQNKTMPPWKADPNYRHFQYERVLDTAEINDIVDWIDGGFMPGNMSLEPPAPVFTSKSRLSSIDLSLKTPAWQITTNIDEYRSFIIPINSSLPQFFNEIEVIPGNDAVLHHVVISADWSKSHYARSLDSKDSLAGYESYGTGLVNDSATIVYAWAPGMGPLKYPKEFGIMIPANADLVVEMHYSPKKKGEWDSTTVNFQLSTNPNLRVISFDPILSNDPYILTDGPFKVPANTIKTFHQKYWIGADVTLFTIWPHMHQIGKSYKVYANNKTTKDTIPLVWIPEWDFHWQGGYTLQKPVKVPKGYYLSGEPTYDNTSSNPNNPSYPPMDVYYGEHTTDEMMFVFFAWTFYQSGDENIILDSTAITGMNPVSNKSAFMNWEVYPNPNNGDALITLNPMDWKPGLTLFLFNSQGQKVREFPLSAAYGQHISLDGLDTGVYFLQGPGKTEKMILQAE